MTLNVSAALQINANVSGTNQVQNLSNAVNQSGQASVNAQIAGQRLINTLQQQIDTFGKTKEQLALMRAEQLGMTQQVAPMIQQLQALRQAQDDAAESGHKFSLSTNASRRELIVLAHELSQGNYSRFGGSMMVLAEQTNAMGFIMSATGVVVGALVVALGGLAYAAIKGHAEFEQLQKDIQLTGGYAGVTAGQVDVMARSMNNATGQGVHNARIALDQLIASGRFTGPVLTDVGNAAIAMSKLTGQSSDDIIKDMSKMADGVVKWADEHNKQYHFMDLALYDHIKQLEETGNKQEAIRLIAQRLYDEMGTKAPEKLGTLAQAWKNVKDFAASAWDAMMGLGKPETLEQQIEKVKAKLATLKGYSSVVNIFGNPVSTAGQEADLQKQLAQLTSQQVAAAQAAKNKAEKEAARERAIDARKAIDGLKEQNDKTYALSKALRELRQNFKALADVGQPVSAADQARLEKEVRDKYKEKKPPANKLDNAYKSEYDRLGGQAADLRDQIAQYEEYGKAVDKSTLAQLNFQLASGRLKGLSAGQVATLRSMAAGVDSLNRELSETKTAIEVANKVEALDKETEALKNGKAASQEAAVIAEYEKKGVKAGTAAYQELTRAVHENKVAKDEANNDAWAAQQAEVIDGIISQTDALTQSSLQQKILTHDRQIDMEVVRQSKNETAEGIADLKARAETAKRDYADAVTDMDSKTKEFSTGAQQGFNSVFEEMENRANDGKKLFSDMFNGLTTTLTKFVTTGKLSFGDLAKSIIDDLAQMEIKALIVLPLMQMINGGLGGTQTPAPIAEGLPGRAAGGPVNPGELYQVNENGPELLNVGGRSYLMMGGQGGSVTPNNQIPGGGASVVQHITIDARGADASVDAKISQAMQAAQNNAVAAITQSLRNGGTVARLTGMA